MIDFHSHILPAIDDGAKNANDSFELIKEAQQAGFKAIISTSHYLDKEFEVNEFERKILLDAIDKKIHTDKIANMNLYLASEIFINYCMVDFIKEKKASTINNSRYVLFEFSMKEKDFNLKEIIYKMLENKYIPIIAHPERYAYVQENPNCLIELIKMGVLLQSNFGSIIGVYGNKAQKTVKKLLANNFIHFLGSDAHRPKSIYPKIQLAINEIKKIVSEKYFEDLVTNNASKVLKDETIDIIEPTKIKFWF